MNESRYGTQPFQRVARVDAHVRDKASPLINTDDTDQNEDQN